MTRRKDPLKCGTRWIRDGRLDRRNFLAATTGFTPAALLAKTGLADETPTPSKGASASWQADEPGDGEKILLKD